MRKKFTPVLDQLLPGLVLVALGIIILCWKTTFLRWTLLLVEMVCLVSGVAMLVMLLLRRKELGGKRITLSGALISVGIGLAMNFVLDYQVYILGLLFSVYVLINAAAKLVNFILFAKNKVKGRTTDLFDCLFFLTFGVLLLFTPILPVDSFLIIIGIYAILLGSFNLIEFIRSMLPSYAKTRMRRKVRISLPVFLVAFVPHRVLKRINAYLSQNADGIEGPEEFTQYKENVPAETPDLEVFVHVTEDGSGAMGHCDFCFDGQVISYGNYDEYSRRLFEGVGDGVLFYAPKERYVPFVIRYSRKTLFGFGLKLTEEQKQAVRRRLEEITAPLYRWKSPYEWDLENKCEKPLEYYPDYASQLYRYTGAEFCKFNSGKFKSYFVLSTNCVQLVDAVLSSAGTDIVKINGIITPGTYYDYLDREFVRPDTMVISRTIYAEDPDNPSEIPRETDVRARYKELCEQEKQAVRIESSRDAR
ncbi:MAG: HdeD family acid-resistance protein [Oscillospiraceae bacterium]|jgi:uncharacterized membrane protein HdeD (DUF308 family)